MSARVSRWDQWSRGAGSGQLVIIIVALLACLALAPLVVFVSAKLVLLPLAAGGALALFAARGLPRIFLGSLAVLLIGYAFLGKSFAYIGSPPVYIGELVLGLGLLVVLRRLGSLRVNGTILLLGGYMLLGALRTVPYIAPDGFAALRDGVLWGYGLFALAVYLAVGEHELRGLVRLYRRLLPVFVCFAPLAAVAGEVAVARLPTIPGSGLPVLSFKGGDMGVHLAAAGTFLLLGLYQGASEADRPRLGEVLIWPIWLIAVGLSGTMNRGGFVAVVAATLISLTLRPSMRWVTPFVIGAMLGLSLLLANPSIPVSSGRSLSVEQIGRNALSIVSSNDQSLQATKTWRLKWWGKIVDYTLHGPYFWTGKGFGINLANSDGFQVTADDSLRAPHSAHFDILARMGVPGLVLWVALQLSFAAGLLGAALRAHRAGQRWWSTFDIWLLAYWLAMMANASFDVYLEGPQGGIWFWSIFGFGLAAMRTQRELFRRECAATVAPQAPALLRADTEEV